MQPHKTSAFNWSRAAQLASAPLSTFACITDILAFNMHGSF